MQKDKTNYYNCDDAAEIDLLALVSKVWQRRKTVYKWCAVGAVIGLVIAFSIPRQYTTTVRIAPEFNGSSRASGSSAIAALANMAGINLNSGNSIDAVYPTLYPDIVASIPFITDLFDIPVTDVNGTYTKPLRQYLKEDVRAPWWSAVIGAPAKLISAIRPADDAKHHAAKADSTINNFNLTKEEMRLYHAIAGCIGVNVENKTYVVTISVTLQDPMVSAIVADSVVSRLKTYITNYRTDKSRKDYEFYQKITEEAKAKYYDAQQKYANYVDLSHNMVRQSDRTYGDRLQNEAQLAFTLYNQTAQQMQLAKAKVQETTPVFAVLEPATVPQLPSKPSKAMILITFIFLAFVGATVKILFGGKIKGIKTNLKNSSDKADSNADKH